MSDLRFDNFLLIYLNINKDLTVRVRSGVRVRRFMFRQKLRPTKIALGSCSFAQPPWSSVVKTWRTEVDGVL